MELYCWRCGKGSPTVQAGCSCPLEYYMIKMCKPSIASRTLQPALKVVYSYDNQALFWHFGISQKKYVQAMLPRNVYPIPRKVMSEGILSDFISEEAL